MPGRCPRRSPLRRRDLARPIPLIWWRASQPGGNSSSANCEERSSVKANVAAAFIAALALGILAARPGFAQPNDREAFEQARAQLETLDRDQQFLMSSTECVQHLDARRRDPARIWCALASKTAVARIDRQYGLEAF